MSRDNHAPKSPPFICHVFLFEEVEIEIPIPQHSARYIVRANENFKNKREKG